MPASQQQYLPVESVDRAERGAFAERVVKLVRAGDVGCVRAERGEGQPWVVAAQRTAPPARSSSTWTTVVGLTVTTATGAVEAAVVAVTRLEGAPNVAP